jgi:hypothetical protein
VTSVWRTLGGYVFWTYDRGSIHYDVMVTIILLFVFLAPRWVNFNDRPTERTPQHQTGVLMAPDGSRGFILQVDGSAATGATDEELRAALRRVIEPYMGEVEITRYEAVRDARGQVRAWRAWVTRP